MNLFGISGANKATGKISSGQAALIMIGTVLSITVFILPGPPVLAAGNDGYLSPALATIPSVLQLAAFYWLAKRFGWQSPFQYLPRLLGRFLGTAVSCVWILLLVFLAGSVDGEISVVLGGVFMPRTPSTVFVLLSVLTAAYAGGLGMEAFGRLSQLLVPLLLVVLGGICLFHLPNADFGFLLPVLHRGWRPAVRGMATPLAMRSEAGLVLALLIPHLRKPQEAIRTGILASCVIGLFLVANAVTVICILSPSETGRLLMPTLSMVEMLQITRGIEHLDLLIQGPWLMALVLKIGLFVALAADGLQQVTGTKNFRSLVLPLAILAGVLGMWSYPNQQSLTKALTDAWPGMALVVNILLPIVLVGLAIVFGRKGPGEPDGATGSRGTAKQDGTGR